MGHAVSPAVSHQLQTVVARVWACVRSCEICGRQSGTGAGFLQKLRFPLPLTALLITIHYYPGLVR
jgi:hypothetical protein